MPNHLPALAARAAVVTTVVAAASVVAVLPASAEPAPAPVAPVALAVAPAVSSAHSFVESTAPVLSPAAATRAAALDFAMSKIGSPYRYGSSGPNAFDCSGLVSWAFKQAGTSLPRTSRAQSSVGTPVSRAELQPGDLVFFYKPVSHVGIYIGNNQIVHASTSKSPVKISDMSGMRFNSARRI